MEISERIVIEPVGNSHLVRIYDKENEVKDIAICKELLLNILTNPSTAKDWASQREHLK